MRNLALLVLCLAVGPGFPAPLLAAKDKGLDVLISADAIPSPEGFRPTPGKPIHYILAQNRQTLGDPVAGVKLPPPVPVENAIVAELLKQGFVRAEVGGPLPQIFILATIGDANFEPPPAPRQFENPLMDPDLEPYLQRVNIRQVLQQNGVHLEGGLVSAEDLFGGPDTPYPSPNPETNERRDLVVAEAIRLRERDSSRGKDRGRILALVGAEKVDKAVSDRSMSSAAAERIVWATRTNQLYITLQAYDAQRWREKQRVLLWRTTMLIDWREDFGKSLEAMLAQAGPLFGTDVAVPGFVNTARSREGKVEIGEATVAPPAGSAPADTKK